MAKQTAETTPTSTNALTLQDVMNAFQKEFDALLSAKNSTTNLAIRYDISIKLEEITALYNLIFTK